VAPGFAGFSAFAGFSGFGFFGPMRTSFGSAR
jgi:hypothetical protein